jgi:hypothetical protein
MQLFFIMLSNLFKSIGNAICEGFRRLGTPRALLVARLYDFRAAVAPI